MIGDTFTIENLERILEAMNKIAPIDRSQYFENYLSEVKERLRCAKFLAEKIAEKSTPQPTPTEDKDLHGETVRLKKSEVQMLIDKHGLVETYVMINMLDNYKKRTNKEYKSDFHAINNWVVEWYKNRERNNQQPRHE